MDEHTHLMLEFIGNIKQQVATNKAVEKKTSMVKSLSFLITQIWSIVHYRNVLRHYSLSLIIIPLTIHNTYMNNDTQYWINNEQKEGIKDGILCSWRSDIWRAMHMHSKRHIKRQCTSTKEPCMTNTALTWCGVSWAELTWICLVELGVRRIIQSVSSEAKRI